MKQYTEFIMASERERESEANQARQCLFTEEREVYSLFAVCYSYSS